MLANRKQLLFGYGHEAVSEEWLFLSFAFFFLSLKAVTAIWPVFFLMTYGHLARLFPFLLPMSSETKVSLESHRPVIVPAP